MPLLESPILWHVYGIVTDYIYFYSVDLQIQVENENHFFNLLNPYGYVDFDILKN